MISFEDQGWEDYLFWHQTDKAKLNISSKTAERTMYFMPTPRLFF